MTTSSGGGSSDCPEASLQYCPLSQLEKLEAAADLIGQSAAGGAGDATPLKKIVGEMRQHGLNCASGLCRFLSATPCRRDDRGGA